MMRKLLFALFALFLIASPASAQQLPAPGQWLEIPNTQMLSVMPTAAELGAAWCDEIGCPDGQMAWVGMAMQDDKILFPRGGGHWDWGGGESYAFNRTTLKWDRVEPVQHLTGPLDLSGRCPKPAYGPASNHTYGGVAALGNGELFFMGNPPYCRGAMANPQRAAYRADTKTDPWTWTELPHLATYGGPAATDVRDGKLYIMEDEGKFAVVDIATMAILKPGSIGAVKKNGVSLPGTSSFASQMAAGAISTTGQFCTGSPTAVTCSNIYGVKVNSNNDDSFGKVIRRPIGTSAPAGSIQSQINVGKYAFAAMPDGWLAIWTGSNFVVKFRPDDQPYHAESDGHACSNAELPACAIDGDEWELIAPGGGPINAASSPYSKMFWWAEKGVLIFVPSPSSNVWLLNPMPNQAPVANDDAYIFAEDTIAAGNVLANDTDHEGTALTAAVLTEPAVGLLVLQSDGNFTYEPPADFFGEVTFEYTASDGELSDTATVTLTVIDVPEEQASIGTPDFAARCAGAMLCQGFDGPIPYSSKTPQGIFINGGSAANPTAVRPKVENGVLRFTILNHSTGADAGQYYAELPEQIGPGESVFIQWRQFMPASLVNTTFLQRDGVKITTPKMLILDRSGTSSCSESPNLHYVVVKANWGGVAAYTRCPSSENIETPGPVIAGSRVFDSQPISDDYRLSHQCWTNHRDGCVRITPDVWITHQSGIECPTEAANYKGKIRFFCRVRHWQTVDGEETALVIDKIVPIAGVDAKWGRAWFLPYMTYKGAQQDHADTGTDLDEVIFSRQRIPDPV